MSNKANVTAYQALQYQMSNAYRLFLEAIARNTSHIDADSLSTAKLALEAQQAKLTGILLLPIKYPQTAGRLDELYSLYVEVIGSKQPKSRLTPTRQRNHDAFVAACMQLLLDGSPVTSIALSGATGIPWVAYNQAFGGGIKEVREIAFERLIAEAKRHLGIQDPPA